MSDEYLPFDLVGNSAKDEEAKARDRIQAEQDSKDLQWVMDDERGRRFVWWVLSFAGLFRSPYTGEAISHAFNEGIKQIGYKLNSELKTHCYENFILMERERQHGGSGTNTSNSSS